MSYDIRIAVKLDKFDKFVNIGAPEYDSPTYNLRDMFVACMDWDYSQGEYYKCTDVLPKVERGIKELHTKPMVYDAYNPTNGWGSREGAIRVLESLRKCILEKSEDIPIDYLWMTWG